MRVCVDLPLGRCKGTHSDVLTVSASGHFHNLQLQKSPTRGLLRIRHRSPGSGLRHSLTKIAGSLRRTFEKFPFLGDVGRRLGAICTAWPSRQCKCHILCLGRRQIGNAEPGLPCRACSASLLGIQLLLQSARAYYTAASGWLNRFSQSLISYAGRDPEVCANSACRHRSIRFRVRSICDDPIFGRPFARARRRRQIGMMDGLKHGDMSMHQEVALVGGRSGFDGELPVQFPPLAVSECSARHPPASQARGRDRAESGVRTRLSTGHANSLTCLRQPHANAGSVLI
jgi:hypothetical protein